MILSISIPREPEQFDVVLRRQATPYTLFLSSPSPSPYVYRDPTPEDLPLIARAALEQLTPEQRDEHAMEAMRAAGWSQCPETDGANVRIAELERERDEWKANCEKAWADSSAADDAIACALHGWDSAAGHPYDARQLAENVRELNARAEKAERLATTLDACNRTCVEPEVHRAADERARNAERELARVRPVVEAAREYRRHMSGMERLIDALDALDKEARDGA
jgi:hypothetical protein